MRNLAVALVLHSRISTTLAKARALRPYVERLITKAVKANLTSEKSKRSHYFQLIAKRLHDKKAASLLFRIWGKHFVTRLGGYTRIVKLGPRPSDSAQMALIEMVGDSWFWDDSVESSIAVSKRMKRNWPELIEHLDEFDKEFDELRLAAAARATIPNIAVVCKKAGISTAKVSIKVSELNAERNERFTPKDVKSQLGQKGIKKMPSMFPFNIFIKLDEGGHKLSQIGDLPANVSVTADNLIQISWIDSSTEREFSLEVSCSGEIKTNQPIIRILRENGATVTRGRLQIR